MVIRANSLCIPVWRRVLTQISLAWPNKKTKRETKKKGLNLSVPKVLWYLWYECIYIVLVHVFIFIFFLFVRFKDFAYYANAQQYLTWDKTQLRLAMKQYNLHCSGALGQSREKKKQDIKYKEMNHHIFLVCVCVCLLWHIVMFFSFFLTEYFSSINS